MVDYRLLHIGIDLARQYLTDPHLNNVIAFATAVHDAILPLLPLPARVSPELSAAGLPTEGAAQRVADATSGAPGPVPTSSTSSTSSTTVNATPDPQRPAAPPVLPRRHLR